jgi:predicted cupin superfamily sugar epimerase
VIPGSALPACHGGSRRAYSVIHALFTPEGFSALHRLISDEIWCFHAGDPLESLRLHPDGRGEWVRLGLAPAAGLRTQDIVGANVWQGTRLAAGGRWALVSCTVVPEFVWTDFELADRAALAASYPAFLEGIGGLTRAVPPAGER